MQVSELISLLQKEDQNATVAIHLRDSYFPVLEYTATALIDPIYGDVVHIHAKESNNEV